jgi:acyl carrier protein
MGLDAVELVMRVEEEFSIGLSDDEAAKVRTVGDLYELVLSKIKTTADCLSSKAFYRTRRALVDALGLPRRSIRPSTDLEPLFPLKERKLLWGAVSDAAGMTIPRLQYSKVWKIRFIGIAMIFSTVLVLSVGVAAHLALGLNLEPQMLGLFYGLFVLAWIVLFGVCDIFLLRQIVFLRMEIPVATAGELTRMVIALNPEAFIPSAPNAQPPSKDQVWLKLVQIICDQLGLDPEEVVPHATFAEDLGVD